MVLDRQNIELVAFYAFDCSVVGIELGDLQVRALHRSGPDGKVVILRGDVDDLLFQVFDGLIASMVAELELEGLGTQAQGYDLMSQAYSKNTPRSPSRFTCWVKRSR